MLYQRYCINLDRDTLRRDQVEAEPKKVFPWTTSSARR